MFQINRSVSHGQYKIKDLFPDIESSPALMDIFKAGEKINDILTHTVVIVSDKPRYMKVDNDNGAILVGYRHVRQSEAVILYLDIIHELVHVRQHQDGLDLYDRSKAYVDRQTEIEAYEVTVKEARRIGLTDREIFDYLNVEWITPEEHLRLAGKFNILP
jgi:hypothetical protein